MHEFEQLEEELEELRGRGYGDHRSFSTEAWMESDDQAIHMRLGCANCGSFTGYTWRLLGSGSLILNPKAAVCVMMTQFSEDTPESCAEARRLNVVRRVMLS
jgi:hypothetical protein